MSESERQTKAKKKSSEQPAKKAQKGEVESEERKIKFKNCSIIKKLRHDINSFSPFLALLCCVLLFFFREYFVCCYTDHLSYLRLSCSARTTFLVWEMFHHTVKQSMHSAASTCIRHNQHMEIGIFWNALELNSLSSIGQRQQRDVICDVFFSSFH